METLFQCVAGLDIHKRTILACLRRVSPTGSVEEEIRTYGAMTRDLKQLRDWISEEGATHVAMESTGVFWKPVWNVLEGSAELILVNARELKQVPGRKSDVADCQWIAHLLGCGLLRSSFVPERVQRELRDLTRHRTQLVSERTRVANRIQKLLEDANIKLASVTSDVLGKSGRQMLAALRAGERDPETLARLALGKLKKKIPELELSLEGQFTAHVRFCSVNCWTSSNTWKPKSRSSTSRSRGSCRVFYRRRRLAAWMKPRESTAARLKTSLPKSAPT